MSGLKLSKCMQVVSRLGQRDQDALLARLDDLVQLEGVPAERAQVMAAEALLQDLVSQKILGEALRLSSLRDGFEEVTDVARRAAADKALAAYSGLDVIASAPWVAAGEILSRDLIIQDASGAAPIRVWFSEIPETDGRYVMQLENLDGTDIDEVRTSPARDVTQGAAFRKWFGDSKVVDESGKPRVVYHGTRADFSSFDDTKDIGYHFGDRRQAGDRVRFSKGGEQIMPVYLSIKKPLRSYDMEDWLPEQVLTAMARGGIEKAKIIEAEVDATGGAYPSYSELRDILEGAGYDGIVYENMHEGVDDPDVPEERRTASGDSYIALRPEQIKSAIGNNGSFDSNSPDITRSTARTVQVDGKRLPVVNSADQPIVSSHDLEKLVNFWRFMADSKVVDEEGRPLVVYHGTHVEDIKTFEPGRVGAIYFTPDTDYAHKYGDTLMPAYLQISKMADLTDPSSDAHKLMVKTFNENGGWAANEHSWQWMRDEDGQTNPLYDPKRDMTWELFDLPEAGVDQALREAGYDGMKLQEREGIDSYAVFDPKQIKSAIGNNGSFSAGDADITRSTIRVGGASTEQSAMLTELRSLTSENPINPRERVLGHDAVIEARRFGGAIDVSYIKALQPGGGRKALAMLTQLADKHGVQLQLYPKKVGKEGLTTAQLKAWYARHGFKAARGGDMVREPVANVTRSTKREQDPEKIFGRELAPLALKARDALSARARSAVDHWNVNWDRGALERAFRGDEKLADVRGEIESAFAPVRAKIREIYGDTVPAWRGEHDWGQSDAPADPSRKLLSWTPTQKIARSYAQNGRKTFEPITDAQVEQAIQEYKDKGFTQLRGNRYLRNKDAPEYYNIYDRDRQFVTDGDDIEAELRGRQRDSVEWNEQAKDGGQLYFSDIPTDSIVWIPSGITGANLSHSEFIAAYNPRTQAAEQVSLSPRRDAASWDDKRISNLLDKYAYVDGGKTKAHAGWVTPDEFLRSTTPLEQRDALEKESTPLDRDRLAKETQEIFLIVERTPASKVGDIDITEKFYIRGHEGRHRMVALQNAGIERVPVVFIDYDGPVAGEPIKPGMYVAPQEWSRGKDKEPLRAHRGFIAGELAPITYENRAELKRRFGGDAEVKFSPTRPQFYSQLQRAIEGVPERLATMAAPQWKLWLDANASKLGVKKDEIEWSGVKDWLAMQGKAKISKDDVAAFVRDNGVQVKDVALGGPQDTGNQAEIDDIVVKLDARGFDVDRTELGYQHVYLTRRSDGVAFEYEPDGNELIALPQDGDGAGFKPARRIIRAPGVLELASRLQELTDGSEDGEIKADSTRYAQYTVPGGENYREVLLTLPQKMHTPKMDVRPSGSRWEVVATDGNMRLQTFSTEAEANAALSRLQLPDVPVGEAYSSDHWDEKNILAHLRIDDRTDADGKRVLFINEIQSDWAQEGRKKGFKGSALSPEEQSKHDAFLARIDDASGDSPDLTEEERQEFLVLTRKIEASKTSTPPAPFVTDTKAWVSLAIKRAIMLAVEGGHDKVALITGEQAADLYDLSKSISTVGYLRGPAGVGMLTAEDLNGNIVIRERTSDDKLADFVGKEVAERLLAAPDQKSEFDPKDATRHVVSGIDLKVGGEGMRAFYDTIVPQVANDILKKVGGGKVGEIVMSEPADAGRTGSHPSWMSESERASHEAEIQAGRKVQPGFDITDSMREQLKDGMPLFSTARDATKSQDFKQWFGKSMVTVDGEAGSKPQVMYHGTYNGGFSNFDRLWTLNVRGRSMDNVGSWFSDSPSEDGGAGQYAAGEGASIYPVYLRVERPKVYDTFTQFLREMHEAEGREMPESAPGLGSAEGLRDKLKAQGYDGIAFMRTENGKLHAQIDEILDKAKAIRWTDPKEYKRLQAKADAVAAEMEGNRSTEFDKQQVYVVFEPEQIKSAIGNIGTFHPDLSDVTLSPKRDQAAIGTTVRDVLEGDEVQNILDDAVGGSAMQGGCLVCAKAIIRAMGGGDLVRIVSHPGGDWGIQTEHYGAIVSGVVYDGSGSYADTNSWLNSYRKTHKDGRRFTVEEGLDNQDDSIIDDAQASKKIGSILAKSLGARDAKRSTLRSQSLPFGYQVSDLLGTNKQVSWWDKTIGTPYHLAQRHPKTFGRVYAAVQQSIADVSKYATRAADLAPTILPQLDTLADITKSPLSAADVQALSGPVFKGTVAYARDAEGKPVLTDDVGTAGVVWTDAELRSMWNLDDRQIGLYREFRKATNKSIADQAITGMLRLAGNDGDGVRGRVLAATRVDEAASILGDHLAELAAKDPERANTLQNTARQLKEISDSARGLMAKGYAPLQRFGKHTVYAPQIFAHGFFEMFESERDAKKRQRELQALFPDKEVTTGILSEENWRLFKGVTPEALELFGEALGLDHGASDQESQVFQEYLKLAKSTRSALKHLIERKGVEGYSQDVGRVLAGFVYSGSRLSSQNLNAREVMQSVAAIPEREGDLRDHAIKFMEYSQNPTEEAPALRALLFANYIGGSVASALTNLTQSLTTTFPTLSMHFGIAKAGKGMADALDIAKNGARDDKDLAEALKKAELEGITAPQEVHHLMAQSQGKGQLKSGDGTVGGNAIAAAGNAVSKLGLAWGKMFGWAELVNRKVAFAAAYKLAREKGMKDPYAFAKQIVADTQFTMNKGNNPMWAHGPVGATLFTFKKFMVMYLEGLARMYGNGPEGKKAFALSLAIMFLMAGAGGFPFADDLDDIIDGFAQRVLNKSFSSKQAKKEFFASVLGDAGADFVEGGISATAGFPIDFSGRLGLGNIIPGTGLLVKKQDYARDVTEIAGAAGDFAKRIVTGGAALAQGDVSQALQNAAPTTVSNALKAADMWQMGFYRDAAGRKVVDTTPAEALLKGIGFQPQSVHRIQEATGTQQELIALNKIRETEIANLWARGRIERKPELVDQARQQLKDWNEANPSSPISIEPGQINSRVREANMSKAQRLTKTAPKELRAGVKAALAKETATEE